MKHADGFLQRITFLFCTLGDLLYNSSEMRIIKFFKSLARDYGQEIKGMPGLKAIPIQLSYSEIAKLTATSPEIAMMVIDDLCAREMVRFSDERLLVKL